MEVLFSSTKTLPSARRTPKSWTIALRIANSIIWVHAAIARKRAQAETVLAFAASSRLLHSSTSLHHINNLHATSLLHFISNAAGPSLWRCASVGTLHLLLVNPNGGDNRPYPILEGLNILPPSLRDLSIYCVTRFTGEPGPYLHGV